jgi:hypothetical protein
MRKVTDQSDRSESGQSLILIAVSMLAVLAMLALAIDFGLAYSERRRMQNAADAGALAGAWVLADGGTDDDIYDAVYQYTIIENEALSFEAYYLPGNQAVGGLSVPSNATGIKVIARTTFDTIFAGVIGFNTITAGATAGSGFSPLDIVLVFDKSGSMDDDSCSKTCGSDYSSCVNHPCHGVWRLPPQPITDAKDAAKAFVDMNNPNLTHVGLVSYSDTASLNQDLSNSFASVKGAIDGLSADGCTNAAAGFLKL